LGPLRWAKQLIRFQQLKGRFPKSVIYPGAFADQSSSLGAYSVLFRDSVLVDSSVGAYTYVQASSALYCADVGSFCSIAGGVTIGLGAHPTHMVSTNPVFYDNQQPLPKFFTTMQLFKTVLPRTTIGPDVWIGQGAMIKAGVRIGPGAVIGAGSVVTKDIPPYAVAVGVPCRQTRMRFSPETCQRLLESHWWDLSEPRLVQLAPSFSDPEGFLALLDRER
jgi:acetyltransferase-like isoleucine patch superfamily enzyme